MDEEELRALQDPTAWDYEHAEVLPPVRDAGAVVAVRFTADEFDRVAKGARAADTTLFAFVRDAVLDRVARHPAREVGG